MVRPLPLIAAAVSTALVLAPHVQTASRRVMPSNDSKVSPSDVVMQSPLFSCALCSEPLSAAVHIFPDCRHTFHTTCLADAGACPLCKPTSPEEYIAAPSAPEAIEDIFSIRQDARGSRQTPFERTYSQLASMNSLDLLSALDEAKISINATNAKGETLLFQASRRNLFDLVQLLCNAGADTNIPNAAGISPLAAHCMLGEKCNYYILKTLLAHEADANGLTFDAAGREVLAMKTPLVFLAHTSLVDNAALLITSGGTLGATDFSKLISGIYNTGIQALLEKYRKQISPRTSRCW